jgi:Ca2+:H+ antiporter
MTQMQVAIATLAALLTAAAGGLEASKAAPVARFVVSAMALASLALLLGQAVEQLGERTGPGPTALVQSTLGNLPELFVGLFALRAGLASVLQAALVGSILGSSVLVLGCAFVAGGLRHGTQRFDPEEPRLNAALLLLVAAALLVPTLAHGLGTPAARHSAALSDVCAVMLLVVFATSIPFYLRREARQPGAGRGGTEIPAKEPGAGGAGGAGSPEVAGGSGSSDLLGDGRATPSSAWPLALSLPVLAAGGAGAAAVSDWFVSPLRQATASLGLSQAFTGLVVVAIASNVVEHSVGIRFALRAKPAYAISTILNSPLQVALFLVPTLVLVSSAIGPAPLTLVFPPLLVAAVAVSAVVVLAVVYDGEYTWIEGVALIGLYFIIAAGFWWG